MWRGSREEPGLGEKDNWKTIFDLGWRSGSRSSRITYVFNSSHKWLLDYSERLNERWLQFACAWEHRWGDRCRWWMWWLMKAARVRICDGKFWRLAWLGWGTHGSEWVCPWICLCVCFQRWLELRVNEWFNLLMNSSCDDIVRRGWNVEGKASLAEGGQWSRSLGTMPYSWLLSLFSLFSAYHEEASNASMWIA